MLNLMLETLAKRFKGLLLKKGSVYASYKHYPSEKAIDSENQYGSGAEIISDVNRLR